MIEALIDFRENLARGRKDFGQGLTHADGLRPLARKYKCFRHARASSPALWASIYAALRLALVNRAVSSFLVTTRREPNFVLPPRCITP